MLVLGQVLKRHHVYFLLRLHFCDHYKKSRSQRALPFQNRPQDETDGDNLKLTEEELAKKTKKRGGGENGCYIALLLQ